MIQATPVEPEPIQLSKTTFNNLIPAENPVGAYAGHIDSMMVMFRALNKHGQPRKTGGKLEKFSVYTNGEKVENVEDVGEGLYCFDYQSIHGKNEIDVQFNGKSIKGFPLVFYRKRKEDERKKKEEDDRKKKDDEDRKKKEDEDRKRKEDEDRKRKDGDDIVTGKQIGRAHV